MANQKKTLRRQDLITMAHLDYQKNAIQNNPLVDFYSRHNGAIQPVVPDYGPKGQSEGDIATSQETSDNDSGDDSSSSSSGSNSADSDYEDAEMGVGMPRTSIARHIGTLNQQRRTVLIRKATHRQKEFDNRTEAWRMGLEGRSPIRRRSGVENMSSVERIIAAIREDESLGSESSEDWMENEDEDEDEEDEEEDVEEGEKMQDIELGYQEDEEMDEVEEEVDEDEEMEEEVDEDEEMEEEEVEEVDEDEEIEEEEEEEEEVEDDFGFFGSGGAAVEEEEEEEGIHRETGEPAADTPRKKSKPGPKKRSRKRIRRLEAELKEEGISGARRAELQAEIEVARKKYEKFIKWKESIRGKESGRK